MGWHPKRCRGVVRAGTYTTPCLLFNQHERHIVTQHHLHIGDSLEVLRNMPDKSVQFLVTSPPYANQRRNTYGGVHPDDYVTWFRDYAYEMYRVLADDGSFILNIKENVVNGQRHTYVIRLVLDLIDMGWLWTEEYIWHKTTTTPGKWPNRFRDLWEHCYHFTKQKKFVMNQDAVKVPIGDWAEKRLKNLSEKDKTRQGSSTGSGFGKDVSAWVDKKTVYPGNVLHGASETRGRGHSAVYPVWLPEWFIKLFSNPGDTVCDPFVGSGSTMIAAANLDRSSIGIELLDDYAHVAAERFRAVHPTVNLNIVSQD